MMSTQPKGRWVYSWEFKKYFFIDEQNRIIDPEVAQLQKPANLSNVLTPAQTQKAVAPAPIQRNVVQRTVAPAPVQRNIAPAPARRTVSPAQIQRNVTPAPPQQRNVAPAPVQRANPAPVQRQTTVVPAPANFAQRLAAPTTRVQRTAPQVQPRRSVPRQNRSASVSSSGSARSASSKRSTSSRSSTKKTERYQIVYLNRKAVVRSAPFPNTRVIKNLDKDAEITIDTFSVRTIWYNDNMRKRIKIVDPERDDKKKVGWITVETDSGRLYRKYR